jgi:hypothetical protein
VCTVNLAGSKDLRLVLAVAALTAACCVATLAYVLVHSRVYGLHFTGPYAALFAGDQLRYLAWIRDAGLHGLIADPYTAGASHLYLQPEFLISGLLWRAGLSLQLAYLVWTPVALATLIYGYAAFTRRYLSGREWVAALAISLLFLSPFDPLLDYSGIVNANGANDLVVMAGHGAAYWQAWGFLPTVIALGLMPLFVLGLAREDHTRRTLTGTALAGALAAWLHPWGGIELVMISAGFLLLRRGSRAPKASVVIAAFATSLPLIYYAALAGADSAWSFSELRAGTSGPVWPLVFDFGPLLLVALPALRHGPANPLDQRLLLWLAAVAVTYIAFPNSRDAALEGVSLPLAVLAVRGWRYLKASRTLGWIALALAILPGAFYSGHTFHDLFRSHDYPFAISAGEQRAVDAVERDPPRHGTVLATGYLRQVLPAFAGLLDGQAITAPDAVFDGRDAAALATLVNRERVSAVLSDCLRGRADLSASLAPLGFTEHRYGCARIWRRLAVATP